MSSHSEDYFIHFQLTKQCWNLTCDFHSDISIIHTVLFLFMAFAYLSYPPVCLYESARLPLDRNRWNLILVPLWKRFEKSFIFFKSKKNIGHFTWRPKCFLLLAATLNRHKTLSSSEMASGCHCCSGGVNNSKRFISASMPQKKHFSVHMAQRWIFCRTMFRFTIERKMFSFHGNNI